MKTNIDQLTIAEAREIAAMFPGQSVRPAGINDTHPYELGANYFIRTVTHHLTGKLVRVTDKELVLENAAWIADDGRLSESVPKSAFSEVEMFPDRQLIVGRGSLIDAITIEKLPTSTK